MNNQIELPEPLSYFQGRGGYTPLPAPTDVLLFLRRHRNDLQQQALQNRSHHRWVLLFNLETAGQVHVDHRSTPLQPGQAMLIMPYQFHHYTHLEASELQWLFCTFDMDHSPLLDRLRHQVVDLNPALRELQDTLVKLWHRSGDDPESGPVLRALLSYLLLNLRLLPASPTSPPPTDAEPRFLEQLHRVLEDRVNPVTTAAGISERLGVSASGLRSRFRSVAGVPLGEYLRNYRLNRSMALLRTTTLPISEIAIESGYDSPQAFSRAFRNATGQTPRAYRNKAPEPS